MNLRRDLEAELATSEKARFFVWEEDRMYTKPKSELIQQYLQQHGRLPGTGADLDDLSTTRWMICSSLKAASQVWS